MAVELASAEQEPQVALQLALALAPQRLKTRALGASSLAYAAAQLPTPNPSHLAHTLTWLNAPQTHIVDWFSPWYPELLRAIHQPPSVLFVDGDVSVLQQPQLAIVGSRRATPSGLHSASYFATQLTAAGLVVTSGLAMGIDAAAHRAAMQHGRTVAVLGCGIDGVYPARNRHLHREIAANGALVSEFPPGYPVKSDHFPRRNRIICGLSTGVLVVEAKQQSGTLITARLALAEGRELFVVPNSMWETAADGSNRLIQEGAKLVLSVADIVEDLPQLEPVTDDPVVSTENKLLEGLANPALLANVGIETTTVDTLVKVTGLSVAEVTEQLTLLELAGAVVSVPGGYIRMGRR